MRIRAQFALSAIVLAAILARPSIGLAQSGVAAAGAHTDQGDAGAGESGSQTSPAPFANGIPSDQTLEIAPRIAAPPPAPPPPEPDSGTDSNAASAPADNPQTAARTPPPNSSRPYLGIDVQTIYSNDRPASLVTGLEVVSVDSDSPAAVAGLRGRTKMSSTGETGATVGALVPPLNLFVMPLLKKTGSLGQGGDLITAIDDRRVVNNYDLQNELESLKPGDVIYLTIVRAAANGSQQTLKLPIKLGDASKTVANAGDAGDVQSSTNPTASTAKQP
jgi:S1-C subfamily serine protease